MPSASILCSKDNLVANCCPSSILLAGINILLFRINPWQEFATWEKVRSFAIGMRLWKPGIFAAIAMCLIGLIHIKCRDQAIPMLLFSWSI